MSSSPSRPRSAPPTPAVTSSTVRKWCGGRKHEKLSFVIAYDGTTASRNAMNLCTDFFLKHKKEATLDVLHIYDPEVQSKLPYAFKAKTLEGELSGHGVVLGPHRYRSHLLPRREIAAGAENRVETIGKVLLDYTLKSAKLVACNVPASVAGLPCAGDKVGSQARVLSGAEKPGVVSSGLDLIIGGSSTENFRIPESTPEGSEQEEQATTNSVYVDFLVLGFKGSSRFKSVDDVLLSSSIHYCLQNASTSMIIVKNRFDPAAFAQYLSVSELLQQRRLGTSSANKYNVFATPAQLLEDADGSPGAKNQQKDRGCHILVCFDTMPWSEKALVDALRISGIEKSALPDKSGTTAGAVGAGKKGQKKSTVQQKNDRITLLHVLNEEEYENEAAKDNLRAHYLNVRKLWIEKIFAHVLYTDEGAEERADRESRARASLQKQETEALLEKQEDDAIAARRKSWEDRGKSWEEIKANYEWQHSPTKPLQWRDEDEEDASKVPTTEEETTATEKETTKKSTTPGSSRPGTPGTVSASSSRRGSVAAKQPAKTRGANKTASTASNVAAEKTTVTSTATTPGRYKKTTVLTKGSGTSKAKENSASAASTTASNSSSSSSCDDEAVGATGPQATSTSTGDAARKFRAAVRSLKWSQRLKIHNQKDCLTRQEKLQRLLDRVNFKTVRNSGSGVAKDLLSFADENNCSMLCIGTDAARLKTKQSYLGSVAAHVLCEADIPVVIARYDEESFRSIVA
ncbi:unnamed protein product [Amoebophrya sp. A120]|nr:unnamed protein product [Amoebophrya sp. A120]|eukprot:GSA120T00001724001.1